MGGDGNGAAETEGRYAKLSGYVGPRMCKLRVSRLVWLPIQE